MDYLVIQCHPTKRQIDILSTYSLKVRRGEMAAEEVVPHQISQQAAAGRSGGHSSGTGKWRYTTPEEG